MKIGKVCRDATTILLDSRTKRGYMRGGLAYIYIYIYVCIYIYIYERQLVSSFRDRSSKFQMDGMDMAVLFMPGVYMPSCMHPR